MLARQIGGERQLRHADEPPHDLHPREAQGQRAVEASWWAVVRKHRLSQRHRPARQQQVADEDAMAVVLDELMASERFLCFGPDSLAEARNRGYRLRSV